MGVLLRIHVSLGMVMRVEGAGFQSKLDPPGVRVAVLFKVACWQAPPALKPGLAKRKSGGNCLRSQWPK